MTGASDTHRGHMETHDIDRYDEPGTGATHGRPGTQPIPGAHTTRGAAPGDGPGPAAGAAAVPVTPFR